MKTSQQLRQERSTVLAKARKIREEMNAKDEPEASLIEQFEARMMEAEELKTRADRVATLEENYTSLDRDTELDPRMSGTDNPHTNAGNTRGGQHGFSVVKAIREAISGGLTGLEREVRDEFARRSKIEVDGNQFIMPLDLRMYGPQPQR